MRLVVVFFIDAEIFFDQVPDVTETGGYMEILS